MGLLIEGQLPVEVGVRPLSNPSRQMALAQETDTILSSVAAHAVTSFDQIEETSVRIITELFTKDESFYGHKGVGGMCHLPSHKHWPVLGKVHRPMLT